MDLQNVYKIEKFSQDELENVNLLIEHGWTLLQIGTTDYRCDRLGYIIGSETLFFCGADKSTFEAFNLKLHQQQLNIEAAAHSLALRLNRFEEYRKETIGFEKYTISEKQPSDSNNPMEISDDDLPF